MESDDRGQTTEFRIADLQISCWILGTGYLSFYDLNDLNNRQLTTDNGLAEPTKAVAMVKDF